MTDKLKSVWVLWDEGGSYFALVVPEGIRDPRSYVSRSGAGLRADMRYMTFAPYGLMVETDTIDGLVDYIQANPSVRANREQMDTYYAQRGANEQ